MLRSLTLINFKRYERLDIPLHHKVLVLVGPNSSGKSSIIKSLLSFKQTYEDQNEHSGFLSRGEYVDIGPYSEYIRDHNVNQKCHFIFEVGIHNSIALHPGPSNSDRAWLSITHEEDRGTGHGRTLMYSISLDGPIDLSRSDKYDVSNKRFVIYKRMSGSDERYKLHISQSMFDYNQKVFNRSEKGLTYEKLNKYLSQGAMHARRYPAWGLLSDVTANRFIPDSYMSVVTTIERRLSIYDRYLHADLTNHLYALAALRDAPQRTSPRTDERLKVGAKGQYVASVFSNFRQRALKKGHSKTRDELNKLLGWIKGLDLGSEIKTERWSDLIDLRAIVNGSSSRGESVSDIGVGFSQAFPILVQLAVMPDGSRLIVEQPELHLYPWAQSELGRILCAEAKRGNKNIVLETHSEHIVRGIQTHVSQARVQGTDKYLSHDDVKIIYVHKNGVLEDLSLNEYGELEKRWPKGFFDQGLSDLETIMRNKKLQSFKAE